MEMLVVNAQLLENCRNAFNEIPNHKLCNGKKTYDLASQLDRVFREHEQNDHAEVLQRYVDGLAMGIIRDVNIPFRWQDVPYLCYQVMTVQTVVRALNMIDRFNYNMDMLGREDLIVPVANNEAA